MHANCRIAFVRYVKFQSIPRMSISRSYNRHQVLKICLNTVIKWNTQRLLQVQKGVAIDYRSRSQVRSILTHAIVDSVDNLRRSNQFLTCVYIGCA